MPKEGKLMSNLTQELNVKLISKILANWILQLIQIITKAGYISAKQALLLTLKILSDFPIILEGEYFSLLPDETPVFNPGA